MMRSVRLITYGGLIFTPIMSVWLGRVLDRVPIKNKAGAVFAKASPCCVAAAADICVDGAGPDAGRAHRHCRLPVEHGGHAGRRP